MAVEKGLITRTASSRVLYWGETLDCDVRGAFSSLKVPEGVGGVPFQVALVLDRSGSMESGPGSALEQAKDAASSFVDIMSAPSEVCVVPFSGEASLDHPLSADLDSVKGALAAIQPGGDTAIHEGIEVARQELVGPRGKPGYRRVIILLSDGMSNGEAALYHGQLAKDKRVRLISIALGSAAGQDLLRALASSPDDYYEGSNSSVLLSIYESIARDLIHTVATDVEITEPVAEGSYRVVEGSPWPQPTLMDPMRWALPYLGPRDRLFRYQVEPTYPGVWSVVGSKGRLTYVDSRGALHVEDSPKGPSIFVLPPLWLFWLLLLPLLLLWLWDLLKNLRRPSRKPVPSTAQIDLGNDPSPALAPSRPVAPAAALAPRIPEQVRPALIVGLGSFGAWSLVHLRRCFFERLTPDPAGVHFLALVGEAEPYYRFAGTTLGKNEFLRVPQARPDDPRRRCLDLWRESGLGETLRSSIEGLLPGIASDGRVEVAILSDSGHPANSALLLEVAAELRKAALSRGLQAEVTAFLLGPLSTSDGSPNEEPFSFALLREASRFNVVREPQFFDGDEVVQGGLFDRIFLLDRTGGRGGLSTVKVREGPAPAVADFLTCWLQEPVSPDLHEFLRASQSDAAREERASGEAMVATLGAFSYRIPVMELARLALASTYRRAFSSWASDLGPDGSCTAGDPDARRVLRHWLQSEDGAELAVRAYEQQALAALADLRTVRSRSYVEADLKGTRLVEVVGQYVQETVESPLCTPRWSLSSGGCLVAGWDWGAVDLGRPGSPSASLVGDLERLLLDRVVKGGTLDLRSCLPPLDNSDSLRDLAAGGQPMLQFDVVANPSRHYRRWLMHPPSLEPARLEEVSRTNPNVSEPCSRTVGPRHLMVHVSATCGLVLPSLELWTRCRSAYERGAEAGIHCFEAERSSLSYERRMDQVRLKRELLPPGVRALLQRPDRGTVLLRACLHGRIRVVPSREGRTLTLFLGRSSHVLGIVGQPEDVTTALRRLVAGVTPPIGWSWAGLDAELAAMDPAAAQRMRDFSLGKWGDLEPLVREMQTPLVTLLRLVAHDETKAVGSGMTAER